MYAFKDSHFVSPFAAALKQRAKRKLALRVKMLNRREEQQTCLATK